MRGQTDVCPTYPWYVLVESLDGIRQCVAVNAYTAARGAAFAETSERNFTACHDLAEAECVKFAERDRHKTDKSAEVGGVYQDTGSHATKEPTHDELVSLALEIVRESQ